MSGAKVSGDLDLPRLREWVGRESHARDVVTRGLVTRFKATLDAPHEGDADPDTAPRLIHLCLTLPDTPMSGLGPDGHAIRGGFLPPVPLPRRMWAGGSFTFHRDLRIGDAVQRVSRISDVALKEGRTGRLCFVTVEHAVSVDGELAVEERQDIVYREGETGETTPPTPPPGEPLGAAHLEVDAGAPLLFRYSALTFNTHRIHYDHRYVTEVEKYPGLVVHGPLQATLLYHYAHRLQGRPPGRFTFRSVAPLFEGDGMILNADTTGSGPLKLWTSDRRGRVAMKAEATS